MNSSASRVGLIGLGAMGAGMAASLRRAGHVVHVFDVRPAAVAQFVQEGGQACASLAELGAACDVIFSVVVNATQTEAVLFGDPARRAPERGTSEHGDAERRDLEPATKDGCAAHMRPGSVFVMCSTVDPQFSIGLERRLAALGLGYVDAPISGGAARAASGQITMMTAGKADAWSRAEPFMNAIAARVYRLGEQAGAGSKVKIINQLLAGVHIAAAAEAMALGLREGLEAKALYEVITNSAGNSWMFENRMAHVLANDYTPLSAVDIFVKDLGLVLDVARSSKFPLPLSSTAHQMFMQASTQGHGLEDDSAVIKIFPGIRLPGQTPS